MPITAIWGGYSGWILSDCTRRHTARIGKANGLVAPPPRGAPSALRLPRRSGPQHSGARSGHASQQGRGGAARAVVCARVWPLRLLAVCGALHAHVQPSVDVTVLTVPTSRSMCARASQSGWPRSVARHPAPGRPVSAHRRTACCRQGARPAAWRGGGLHPGASTTLRMRALRDCGTIACEIPLCLLVIKELSMAYVL
jgi:hypothetical protein